MGEKTFNLDDKENFSDEQLIVFGRNDVENSPCIDELIRRYMRLISIKASKMTTKSNMEFDDLVSEGLLGLLNAIRCFDAEKSSSDGGFRAFADICITNRMKTAVVGVKNNVNLDYNYDFNQIEDEQISTEDFIIDREQNSELFAKLSNVLTETEFSVLQLYLKKYSYSKIAEKIGITEKSVDNALQRSRVKLRNYFKERNKY